MIILLADGLSVGHRTAARILSKGVKNGMYQAPLAMDNMPHMALLGTSSVDTIAADSANTASAYMTGHKSSVNALGVYADRTKASQDDPRQETIAELLRRKTGKAIGVVSDAEIEDATPASVVAHTRRRSDKADIVGMFYEVRPEVILGGGSAYFLPQGTPGSKRKDSTNYLELFQKDGYNMAKRTPVAFALGKQLALLKEYGYRVVSVGELMEESPFTDVGRDDPLFEKLVALAKTRAIVFTDNKLRLDDKITVGELAMLLAPRDEALSRRVAQLRKTGKAGPYDGAMSYCRENGLIDASTKAEDAVTKLPDAMFDKVTDFTRRNVYAAYKMEE